MGDPDWDSDGGSLHYAATLQREHIMSTHDFEQLAGQWVAVQVWAGREHVSASHLQLRGLEVFLPRYTEQRRWSDRMKRIERALFAGYVFCRLAANLSHKIVTAPGVIRIVGDGRRPLPVPEHEVAAVQRIVGAGLTAEPCDFLQAGQRVRVEMGPLRGTEGIVLSLKSQRRLIVSIPLLQRSVSVELVPEWVSGGAA